MTMIRTSAQTLNAIILMLSLADARATMVETYPVRLSSRDKAAVVDAACRRSTPPAAERLSAYRYFERRGEPITVDIVCGAHRTTPEGIVRARAVCDNMSGRWRCSDEGDFLEVKVGSRTAHVLASGPEADTAANIAGYLLSVDSYDGQPLANRIDGSTCSVSANPPDVWDVSCGYLSVEVSRDCDHGSCVYRAFGPLGISIP